jgi:hypothetical protein
MAHSQPLTAQALQAYEVASTSACPDWRTVAELFRAAIQATRAKPAAKRPTGALADYNGPTSCLIRYGAMRIPRGNVQAVIRSVRR